MESCQKQAAGAAFGDVGGDGEYRGLDFGRDGQGEGVLAVRGQQEASNGCQCKEIHQKRKEHLDTNTKSL